MRMMKCLGACMSAASDVEECARTTMIDDVYDDQDRDYYGCRPEPG